MSPGVHPKMFPFASSFSTQMSQYPAPNGSVYPATIYPPSEVCWME